jgi:hypothetical protein
MSTRVNQSYAAVSSNAGEAGRLYSQAIKDTEKDRKAEARKVRKRGQPTLDLWILSYSDYSVY